MEWTLSAYISAGILVFGLISPIWMLVMVDFERWRMRKMGLTEDQINREIRRLWNA